MLSGGCSQVFFKVTKFNAAFINAPSSVPDTMPDA